MDKWIDYYESAITQGFSTIENERDDKDLLIYCWNRYKRLFLQEINQHIF